MKFTKVLILLFCTLLTVSVKSQTLEATPDGIFDTICDHLGNKYLLNDFQIILDDANATKQVASTTTCSAGYFNVYFATGCGMETNSAADIAKRAVICEVLGNLSGLVNPGLLGTSTRVNILVDNPAILGSTSALAAASGFYLFPNSSSNPGYIRNTVEKTIITQQNAYLNVIPPINANGGAGFYHGVMFFSTSANWHTALGSAPAAGTYDLYSTALHEMTHALGFASLINYNGTSRLGSANPFYTTYDKFLCNASGNPLLGPQVVNCPNYLLNYLGSSTSVSPNASICPTANTNSTNCTIACKYISPNITSGFNMKVYTPNCYEPGSSLSHFEDMCYPTPTAYGNDAYFCMSNALNTATMRRYLKEEERMVLCDLGYSCTAQYTSNAILSTSLNTTQSYSNGACSPTNVWGINDGLNGTNYVWTASTGPSTINIPVSTISSNDSPGSSPICIAFAYNYPLGLNVIGNNIQVTLAQGVSFCGPVLLQYLPKNGSVYGNITYVHAYINCPNCNPANHCNLVQNGGFETISNNSACSSNPYSSSPGMISCWFNAHVSPDIFNRNCTSNGLYQVGNSNCLNQFGLADTHNGSPNNKAVGLAYSTQTVTGGSEIVKNQLSSPLVPTATYVISFWAFNSTVQGYHKDAVFSFATEPQFSSGYPPANIFPNNYNTIASFTLPGSSAGTWQFFSKTFVFSSPGNAQHNSLLCAPDQVLTPLQPNPSPVGPYIIIDDVSIVPIGQYAQFNMPNGLCAGGSLTNIAQYADPVSGTFNGPGITQSGGQYNFNSPATLSPGFYGISFSYTASAGCTYTTWSTANIPGITTQTNANTCSSNVFTLSANGFYSGTTYTWLPGGQNSQSVAINPSSSGIYTLIASNGTCTSTYTTMITIAATPTVNAIPPICLGSTSSVLQSYLSASTPTVGVFSGPNVVNYNCSGVICSFISLATATNPAGNYTYTYTIYPDPSLGIYCTVSTTFNVQYAANFTLTASALNVMCTNIAGYQTTITANATPSSGITYTWLPGNLTGQTQVVNSSGGNTFTVSASSANCTYSTTLVVQTSSVCCTSTSVPAFTGSVITSQLTGPLLLNNDVTIASGSTINLVGELIFAPNVKITVPNGSALAISQAHLYSCTDMWQGIVVNDGGKLSTSKSSLIEDAIVAIDVTGHTTSTVTAPSDYILYIQDAIFNKNNVAIKIDNYVRSGTSTYPFLIKSSVFTSRNFTFTSSSWPDNGVTDLRKVATGTPTTGLASPYNLENAALANLKNPYSAQTASIGIFVNNSGWSSGGNYSGVDVGIVASEPDFNLFDNLLFGINGNNSVINSYNNVFQNSQRYHLCPQHCGFAGGYGIYSGVDNNFNNRLNLTSTGTGSTSLSLGNRFWDCHIGVGMSNVYKFDCNYALFRSTQTTTTGVGFAPGNTGIYAATNRFEYTINNCKFNNINTAVNVPISAGTYTWAGNGSGVLASNFNINYNYFGAQLTNGAAIGTAFMNYGVYITAPNTATWNVIAGSPLSITSNTVNRSYRGIYLNGYPTVSTIESNTISLVNDNVFSTNQSAIRVENSTSNAIKTNTVTGANTTNTLASLIYSGSNAAEVVTCNTLVTAYTGFQFDGSHSGTNIWKGNKMTSHVNGYYLTNSGVIGTQGAASNPIDNQWSGSWTGNNQTNVDGTSNGTNSKLYVKSGITYSPTLNSGPNFQNYGTAGYLISTTGSYACGGGCGCCGCRVLETSHFSHGVQNVNTSDRIANRLTNANYVALTNNYRFLMTNDSIRNSDTAFINFCNNLAGTSIGIFMQAENSFYNGDVSQGNSVSSAVTATNDIEANYKNYYDLYTASVNGSFSSNDSTDLFAFASKCPGLDGSCVYQARALYNNLYPISYTFMDNCPKDAGERKKGNMVTGDNTNNWDIELYPNPTRGNISIITPNESEAIFVTIKDVNGRLLFDKNLLTQSFMSNLELNLLNGVYLVTVKNQENNVITKKLVVAN